MTHSEMFVPAHARASRPEGGPGVMGPWRPLPRRAPGKFRAAAARCLTALF